MTAGVGGVAGAAKRTPDDQAAYSANDVVRVAAIIHTQIVSGPGRQIAAVADSLADRNVDMRVIALQRLSQPQSPFIDYLRERGVACDVIPESGPFDARLIRRVGDHFAAFRPDIVQTHGYKPSTVAWALRALGRGRPAWRWIAFWHGTTTENWKVRAYHRLDHYLVRSADRVVLVAESQRDQFRRNSSRVEVIPNAVIPAGVDAPAVSQPLPRMERPVLAVIGRLSSEKGVDVFLHAAAALLQRGVNFSAVIVGDGLERERLLQLRNELRLSERVHFIGHLPDVRHVYESSDLIVIPSRSEGHPNVLLEALAYDRPVAATRVGAIPLMIDSQLVGRLADSDSPDGLADAIIGALSLRQDPRASAERRRVVARYSLSARAEALSRLYRSVRRDGRS